jgi:hypothetical protein
MLRYPFPLRDQPHTIECRILFKGMRRGVKRVVEADKEGEREREKRSREEAYGRGGGEEMGVEGEGKARARDSKRARKGQAAPFIVSWPTWLLPGNCGVELRLNANNQYRSKHC